VSVNDEEDGMTYYAQLRGFLQDQYCGKSAVITWLIPKVGEADQDRQPFPSEFDPNFYVAGITNIVQFFSSSTVFFSFVAIRVLSVEGQ
jgi:hypothetical protein